MSGGAAGGAGAPDWAGLGVSVRREDDGKAGATASFPYDRMTVERFRKAFPQARWRDDLKAWFVPGTTAERRLDRWLGRELAGVLAHADERGRDAFVFEPVASPYLEAAEDLRVRTPYSRTVVDELRAVPWARWDEDLRAWRVPYRSWDVLRRHWPAIEAAAQRNEPDERRKRQEGRKGTPEALEAAARAAERKRRRYPVAMGAMPPPQQPVMTALGIVAFTDVTGEVADTALVERFYPTVVGGDLVWAAWRAPTLDELVKTWPARWPASEAELARGWWQPSLEALREARRKARSRERRRGEDGPGAASS